MLADATGVVLGIVSGVITARWLGPEGKGLFASLSFLSALVMHAASLGLGDAAAVMVGQKRATMQRAISVSISASLGTAVIGMAVLWAAALVAFQGDWERVRSAAVIGCLGLPISLAAYTLTFLLTAQERIVASSVVLGTTAATTTLGLWLFIAAFPLGVAGGMLGGLLSAVVGMSLAATLLARSGFSLRPMWDWKYLRGAVRYGMPIAASYLITVMFLRVDLLLVYGLTGAGPAGQYSVALTVAGLVGMVPIAIAHATFPRLANLEITPAQDLTAQACRLGVVAAAVMAALLLAGSPIAIPVLFGREFLPAVPPTLIMLLGGVIWGTQWLLARAAAARGRPGLLVHSFGLGLAVMVGLDLLLVPALGITGAALGSVAGPAAGLLLCLVVYHRGSWWPLPLTCFVPRAEDLRVLVARLRPLLPFTKTTTGRASP